MHYNSVDHFLTAHESQIIDMMASAQQATGGHYAGLSEAARRADAQAAAQRMMAAVRQVQLDGQTVQATARQRDSAGIPLDDLTRLVDQMETRFIAFVQAELGAQPELAAEILRRLRNANARFRSNVMAVKLDKTIRQLQRR
ncbi:MAG TPA: hypothetical protein VF276_14845 [Chloroflexia bacterium]